MIETIMPIFYAYYNIYSFLAVIRERDVNYTNLTLRLLITNLTKY